MNTAVAIRSELASALPDLLRRVREPAKVIALRIGATSRAVESHRQAEQIPSAPVLLAYARHHPEIRDLVMKLIDVQASNEPLSERDLTIAITNLIRSAKDMG